MAHRLLCFPAMTPSLVDRALRLFGDVRAREGTRLLLLAANLLLLLFAYYLLKTVREPLVLGAAGGGAEVKSYASAAQAVLLIGVASGFGWLASRLRRMTLLATVSLFFASNLVVFYVLFLARPDARLFLGIAFFIWVGCFSVMIVAQFWAFANDLHTKEQGERLFGVIAGGSAIGAVLGAKLAKPLFKLLGPFPLLLIAAGIVVGCIGLTYLAHRLGDPAKSAEPGPAPELPRDERLTCKSGLSLLLHDRYLLFIALLSLVKNWVNTTGEYVLDRRLLEVATLKVGADLHARATFIAAFKSDYFTYVNAAVLGLQLFAVSRLVRYVGVRRALFVLPVIALCGYSAMAVVPILSVILVAKVVENSTDYSLQKTVEQMLYLVTSREAKYKVKSITDTFAVRAGDVMAAALVWVGTRLHFATFHFLLASIALLVGWLGVAFYLGRAHARAAESEGELPVAPARRAVRAPTRHPAPLAA